MDHVVCIIPRILEILEIEVSNILYNPGNIGNRTFFYFLISWKYVRLAGGSRGLGSGGLGSFLEYVPGISGYPANIGNIRFLCIL